MRRLPPIGLRGRLAVSIAVIMAVALAITYVAVYRGTGSDLRDQTDTDLTQEVEILSRSLSGPPPLDLDEYTLRAERLVKAQSFGPASRLIAISVAGGGTATNQPELLGLPSGVKQGVDVKPDRGAGKSASDHSDARDKPSDDAHSDDAHSDDSDSDDSDPDDSHSDDSDHSASDDDHKSAAQLLASRRGFSTVKIEGVGEVRLLTAAVALPGGGSATVRVGQPLAPVNRALDGLSRTFLLVGFITLLVAAAAGWFLASRTARPIRSMAGVAGGVDGGDLSARMAISETRNDEVRRLAESFNLMLDRLEAAFEGQRAFVADASHDLRTPLTIVKGQLEVLARQSEPDAAEVRRVTAQVTAATGRMERLVDDLLLLARTDSGAGAELERGELEPLLTAEAEAFRETAGRTIELGSISSRPVAINREQLARAISNLISNAVTHTSAGGRIQVSAVDRGDRVEINVDDDGPGVPPEMRERVFDRFARLDTSRSSDSGGSGLGLAIVKAVAELHGGEASCSDAPLGGARFTVSLPVSAFTDG
jgi:signal transduction histidine kinase